MTKRRFGDDDTIMSPALCDDIPVLEAILDEWRSVLGDDVQAYRHHCYRVYHLCRALAGERPADAAERIAIAAAFHDLGIWTHGTFDYLGPSRQLARDCLARRDRTGWDAEIGAMIENHHKITPWRAHPDWLVEPFRQADWIDVSLGRLRFGLSGCSIADIRAAFPNAGFHRRLVSLTVRRLRTHPTDPLPMIRL